MTELLRLMNYGVEHPVRLLNSTQKLQREYVVVGCCCESVDIFTLDIRSLPAGSLSW
ncbi:MAG: hypothetical protein JW915_19415 [Chitinispirillaceae bacterium]|nr:hypothetical protein [Chitinispirillaceae bacterium]